jgi:hypothetical protein
MYRIENIIFADLLAVPDGGEGYLETEFVVDDGQSLLPRLAEAQPWIISAFFLRNHPSSFIHIRTTRIQHWLHQIDSFKDT